MADVGGTAQDLFLGTNYPLFDFDDTLLSATATLTDALGCDLLDDGALFPEDSPPNMTMSPPSSVGEDDSELSAQLAEELKRKRAHLASEKKRRNNIKSAFDDMKELIPAYKNFPNLKNSKETVLRKAIEYIKYLVRQRALMAQEIKMLKDIVRANGLDVPPPPPADPVAPSTAFKEEADAATASFPDGIKTLVFIALVDVFYESFMANVKVGSPDEFTVTLLAWIQGYCRPERVREIILVSVRNLATGFFAPGMGSSTLVRKWSDCIGRCGPIDGMTVGRVRGVFAKVASHCVPW